MTLVEWLRGLRVVPGDDSTPFLIVSEGALDTKHERDVTADDYTGNPYVIVYTVANTDLGARVIGGVRDHFSTIDVLIEQRPDRATGFAPNREKAKALYQHIAAHAPANVDHLDDGIPLSGKLTNVGGLGKPETKPARKDWLLGGITFQAPHFMV